MKLKSGLFYSLMVHILIVISMIIQVVFYPDDALDLSKAIRVDMVALPDKVDQAQLPPDQLPEKKDEKNTEESAKEEKPIEKVENKPEPKKNENSKLLPDKKESKSDDSININKVKSKQKEALNKLKAAAAIDKLKKESKKEEEDNQKSKTIYKGRILSAGTSLTGLDKLQSDSYLTQLDAKIKTHWSLPQWLIGKSLRARVQIKFEPNGHVIYKKIVQSSGNPTYDDYCLQAIENADPLPKVPEKFSVVYKIDGITVGFPD